MNYQKLYEVLIHNRKGIGDPVGYGEKHHIIPKSMGGSNDKSNLIKFTAREHFLAHRLLAKIYPTTGMVHAVYKMACVDKATNVYKVASRTYDVLRKEHSKRVSNDKIAARKKSLATKGRKQTKEHILARTRSRKIKGSWLSEETKRKISESNKGKVGTWAGKKLPEDYVARRNATRKANGNYKWTEEQKRKQSENRKGKPNKKRPLTELEKEVLRKRFLEKTTCPKCGKIGSKISMPRWHFDNCKFINFNN